jgi:hypothetical protein
MLLTPSEFIKSIMYRKLVLFPPPGEQDNVQGPSMELLSNNFLKTEMEPLTESQWFQYDVQSPE